jgi:minor extracellular serine protease Vpr
MKRWLPLFILCLLIVLVAGQALADTSKLDPRARIAVSQLQAGAALDQLRLNGVAVSEAGDIDAFITGPVSRQALEALGVQVRTALPGIYTAFIPADAIDRVAALADVTGIRGAVQLEENLNVSVPYTGADLLRAPGPTFTGINGAGVLIGDVDSGLSWGHDDFKDASGLSRILNIWDQTVTTGTPPSGYSYGREWTKAQIDAASCTETDANGHGTHVMGIAAGDGSQTGGTYGVPAFTYTGMAPMADIIEVKSTYTDTQILDGVAYVFGRATALGKNAVCNISLGGQYGPHDGTSPLESGLTALTGAGRIICNSAGNNRGTGASGYPYLHARLFSPLVGDSAKLLVSGASTNPPSGSAASVAIDGYYGTADNINVTLRTPNNTFIGPITLGNSNAAYPGTVYTGVGRVYVENGVYTTDTGKKQIYFEISRTSSTNTPNGTWTFYFTPVSLGGGGGRVDMWRFYTYTTTIANATTFTLKNTNENTVSEPANAEGSITVAAWETKNSWVDCGGRYVSYTSAPAIGAICDFSSQGPTADGRQKPDIAAPGMGIGAARSLNVSYVCASTPSAYLNDGGYHVINQGTSMAAPHVTGACALLMQRYGAMTPAQLKTYLTANAIVDGDTGPVWNFDFGNGKLHLPDFVAPAVTVTYPNGGEVLVAGVTENLTWTATDNVGVSSVDLLLSRNGVGGTYATIASGIANSGSCAWPVALPASEDCWLKVVAHDAAGNTGSDVSNAAFAIIDGAVPALMTEFVAAATGAGVELRWAFSDPSAFGSVRVERSGTSEGPWAALAVDVREENGVSIAVDGTAQSGATYWYRISAVSGGTRMTFGPIEATAGEVILSFGLGQPVPNPTSGSMRVDFAVPHEATVDLVLYDMQGRRVATLVDGAVAAGRHLAQWNGLVGDHAAPAGIYFLRLRVPGTVLSRRLVITR